MALEFIIQELVKPLLETCKQKKIEELPEKDNEQVLEDLSRVAKKPFNFLSSALVNPLSVRVSIVGVGVPIDVVGGCCSATFACNGD